MSRLGLRVPASTPVYRVALVSGANRGLGFEVVRQLSEHGITVLLGARDLDKGLHAARQLAGALGEVIAVQLDVTQQDQVDTLARWIEVTYGRLDVLVNNAGGHYDHDAHASHADLAPALDAMQTHLFGTWRLSSALLPLMRRHGYGRIVNVSSSCGASSSNGGACVAYRTSKSALNTYTRTLAAELEGSGIAVNAVCPGWTATDLGGPGGRPVSVGAAGVVWATSLPTPAPTGRFFRDGEVIAW
ncbi:SDR family NAD(P)-dependent oxidoreductase [Rhodanobacter sp. B2A1Ga4]|uniref:SDR family NAD(P)-dependent oxidoreductase n=1 Tax=Rhodanobacter sp. B2A1Ga4 TaxID=2778647 RepID=UPI001B381C02|nr:SDR family NAD(P)-dependent oxidoreductase [Rhodanobacter sp. B2A1Ga4]MBQ4856345.1 SDR family NAD(P)-dependent oxidoreductase [Rhodanobacter sp. B2A1Ga4]